MTEGKYYRVLLEADDDEGNAAHRTVMAYGSNSKTQQRDFYNIKIENGEEFESSNTPWVSVEKRFDIGEKVRAAVYNDESPLSEDTPGRFLFLELQDGLQKYEVEDSPRYDFEFENEHSPNVFIDGIWFDGKTYHDAFEEAAYYNNELARLNIEVTSDKDKYEPGDEVTLSVKVTDQNGSPSAAEVNLNLVDEAYYKVAYDNFVDPLDDVYAQVSPGVITTYDSHEETFASSSAQEGLGGCFTGDTLITMADGTTKYISEIRPGDQILTKAREFSSELVPGEVVNTVKHLVGEYLVVNDNLEVTGEHIVFVNGKWDYAANLELGDVMFDKDGNEIEIFDIRVVKDSVWVYNFEVRDYHTYFANGLYVHNEKDGGSVRSDFEDVALFESVSVGGNGKGKVTFELPDNITSWRVVAKGIDSDDLEAGSSVSNIAVSLPFFVDAISNTEYSVNDKPWIKVRAFGDAIGSDTEVNFEVEAEGGMDIEGDFSFEALAGKGEYVKLSDLQIGEQSIAVGGSSGDYVDAIRESFEVKGSRLKKNLRNLVRNVTEKSKIETSDDFMTDVYFIDGGVAFYYFDLLDLYYTDGDRLDQRASRAIAAELMKEHFGEDRYYDDSDIVENYQSRGLKLLPYGSVDLKLTAMALMAETDVERYDTADLKKYLYDIYQDTDSNLEEVVLALLGLANLNEPVLVSLNEIHNENSLSTVEKLYIALAFESLGSNEDALEIFNEVVGELADDEEMTYETALGAVLAAGLGKDQHASLLWEFVELTGFEDDLTNFAELAFIKRSISQVPRRSVEFRVNSEKVELDKLQSHPVLVMPGDDLKVSSVKGNLAAVVFYREYGDVEDFDGDERLSISRSYKVDGGGSQDALTEGELVEISLDVSFNGRSTSPFFSISDILPSGLRLVTGPIAATSDYNLERYRPYRVDGQEVSFYWFADDETSRTFTYFARVVNPGEFYAEPATVTSFFDTNLVNISNSDVITIKAE